METVSYIDAVGICGVNGYEAEVNHVIGLCKEARTDYHLLLTVAQTYTHTYQTKQKHRLQYACGTANAKWFSTLFKEVNPQDAIVVLRGKRNETLYHFVCTLPSSFHYNFDNLTPSPKVTEYCNFLTTPKCEHSNSITPPKVEERLQILNLLITTDLDVNIETDGRYGAIAFDLVSYGSTLRYIQREEKRILLWWLYRLDRFNDENRNRCLPWLVCFNKLEAVQRICRNESMNLNIKTIYGETALTMAASNGHLEIVEELLQYYPHRLNNLNQQTGNGKTALHLACRENYIEIVTKLCVIPEIDLNLPDKNSYTPLMIACTKGHTAIVDELLQYYPHRLKSLNYKSMYESPALNLACINKHLDIVKRLCAIDSTDLIECELILGDTPLMFAARTENMAIFDILIQYAPDRLNVNQQRTLNGRTALMIACEKDNFEIVKRLCRIPEIDMQLLDKDAAMSIAIGKGYTRIIDLLGDAVWSQFSSSE